MAILLRRLFRNVPLVPTAQCSSTANPERAILVDNALDAAVYSRVPELFHRVPDIVRQQVCIRRHENSGSLAVDMTGA